MDRCFLQKAERLSALSIVKFINEKKMQEKESLN